MNEFIAILLVAVGSIVAGVGIGFFIGLFVGYEIENKD